MIATPGYSAYKRTQNVAENGREVEYRLLAQVTGAMIEAQKKPADFAVLVDVVLWNRSVWAAFRDDLSHPSNALPVDLKARLISLSLWVDRETFAVLGKQSDLEAIIDVNRMIMDGLKAAQAGVVAAPAAAEQQIPAPASASMASAARPISIAATLARL